MTFELFKQDFKFFSPTQVPISRYRSLVMGWLVSLGLAWVLSLSVVCSVSGIGANWGTQDTHPLPPATVVRMLRDNGFQKVKLFDADYGALRALGRTPDIEVMVGIPNDMLASLASSVKAAERWVSKNVSTHISSFNTNIRYKLLCASPLFPV